MRSFAAALVLALSTAVGFLGALVALAPAVLRGGPQGRRVVALRRSQAEDAPRAAADEPAGQALQR